MSVNKDYILRMAEMAGSALAIALGLRQANKYEDALIYIDDMLLRTVGLTSRFINSLSEEMLLKTISPLGNINVEACFWITTFLKAEGEVYEDQGNITESYYRYHKALYLLLEIVLHEPIPADSDLYLNVDVLIKKLEDYELPSPTKSKLFAYYEHSGNYARAEDTLFDLLESPGHGDAGNDDGGDDAMIERGRAFYRRLQAKSESDLQAGNLSQEEVAEGLAQLDKLHP